MYHKLEVPESCIALWRECQSLVPDLLKDCPIISKDKIIEASTAFTPGSESIFFIKEGEIFETHDGQLIVIYENGDLVNADALSHLKISRYETDFAANVDEYDGKQFLINIAADKSRFSLWNRYLSCLCQSYQLLMCHFSRQDTDYLPEFRQYKKGDIIIKEDTEGDEVFTLLHGTAKVVSKGKEVGKIERNEIFGAIAALTNTMRNATIIATSECDTLVAKSENFQSILSARPDVVHKLIHDMARSIVSSNERIIELSKEKNEPN